MLISSRYWPPPETVKCSRLTEDVLLREPLGQPYVGGKAFYGVLVPLEQDPLLQRGEYFQQHLLVPVREKATLSLVHYVGRLLGQWLLNEH